jgi:hypothetical protein
MARIPVDVSRWPLFVARFPREGVDEVDVLNFYGRWEEEMAKRGRHAALIDMRQMSPLVVSPKLRRFAADQVVKRATLWNDYLVAEARVVDNIVARGVVTAFDWLVASSQLVRAHRNMVSEADAEAWLLGELAKADVVAARLLGEKPAPGDRSLRQL